MILRRVIKHFRNQEWTAIGLDFLIVVIGVFVGIQLGNWNDARGDGAEYAGALARLNAEIDTNLAMLDGEEPAVAKSLATVETAFDVLLSCVDSDENRAIVNGGLVGIHGTSGMHLRRNALQDLTSNPDLLGQQSAIERKRFTDMLFYFDMAQSEADTAEFLPLSERYENNPIISVGASEIVTTMYYEMDFSKPLRRLELNVPIDQACQNDQLIKAFYSWERWQNNIPASLRKIRQELNATKAMLDGD